MIIVYHDPGDEKEVDRLIKLMKENKIDAKIIPISKIDNIIPEKGELIISLIPFRGGHNKSIEEIAKKFNAIFIKMPLNIMYDNLKNYLKEINCKDVCFLYWKAKRFIELQEEDFNEILNNIKNLGIKTYSNCDECHECFVTLTIMRGIMSEKAREYGDRCSSKVIEELLSIIKDDLVKWIKGFQDAGGGV